MNTIEPEQTAEHMCLQYFNVFTYIIQDPALVEALLDICLAEDCPCRR